MRYFIYVDNRQQGPFSVDELVGRGLSSETLVWAEGMEQWTPAWQVKELKDVIEGKVKPGAVPPPLPHEQAAKAEKSAPKADSSQNNGTDESRGAAYSAAGDVGGGRRKVADDVEEIIYEPRRRHIGGRVVSIVIAIIIAFALTVTCPTREQHCEAVAGEISQAISQSAGSSGIFGMFSNVFASGVVNMAVNQFLDVDNYFLFPSEQSTSTASREPCHSASLTTFSPSMTTISVRQSIRSAWPSKSYAHPFRVC